jgi:hypothetical protein
VLITIGTAGENEADSQSILKEALHTESSTRAHSLLVHFVTAIPSSNFFWHMTDTEAGKHFFVKKAVCSKFTTILLIH